MSEQNNTTLPDEFTIIHLPLNPAYGMGTVQSLVVLKSQVGNNPGVKAVAPGNTIEEADTEAIKRFWEDKND